MVELLEGLVAKNQNAFGLLRGRPEKGEDARGLGFSRAFYAMGTNYYLLQDSESDLHIGKSSYGWAFALHVYPDLGIDDWEDWIPLLFFGEIRDEYGSRVSLGTMAFIVTEREAVWASVYPPPGRRLHRQPGAVRQGAGSWDCLEGDFC